MDKVNVVRTDNECEVYRVPKREVLAAYEVSMRRWCYGDKLLPGLAGLLVKRDSGEKTLYISPSFSTDMAEIVIEAIEAERKALVPLDSRVVLR